VVDGTGDHSHTVAVGNRTSADEENISFDRVWMSFAVPFGKFDVGRQSAEMWGTNFGNRDSDADAIHYTGNFGPVEVGAFTEKLVDTYTSYASQTDADKDNYAVYGKYKWNNGSAGLQVMYTQDATQADMTVPASWQEHITYYTLSPYFQATFGPVLVEGELNWATGKVEAEDGEDVDIDMWSAYLHAKANMGPAYFGAFYAFVSGQDDGDDITGNTLGLQIMTGGTAPFDPCLILWGEKNNKWLGRLGHATDATTGSEMENAHLFQIYAGIKPMPKLDLRAAVSYAKADSKDVLTYNSTTGDIDATKLTDDEYGTEVDLTAAYKIYDNLTYTVGFGYLWAGDFYKGTSSTDKIDDTYLLMHRLDLAF